MDTNVFVVNQILNKEGITVDSNGKADATLSARALAKANMKIEELTFQLKESLKITRDPDTMKRADLEILGKIQEMVEYIEQSTCNTDMNKITENKSINVEKKHNVVQLFSKIA